MKIVILIIILFILFLLTTKEHFTTGSMASLLAGPMADPLQLDTYHMYDPSGWQLLSDNVLVNTIKIKAITGQIDYDNIMALPQLGYPNKSGGTWYSSINKLQGTDGWQIWNEARHGSDWFYWRPTPKWQASSKENKLQELEVQLVITQSVPPPEFPLSFSLRFPDYNYGRSVRFWLTLTYPPVPDSFKKYNSNQIQPPAWSVATKQPHHEISAPLLLKYNNIGIRKNLWKINNNVATLKLSIPIQQGGVDWNNIKGPEKNNNGWFSWNSSSGNSVNLNLKINNYILPPKSFPKTYYVQVKDANMERYVYVTLSVEENPFSAFSC